MYIIGFIFLKRKILSSALQYFIIQQGHIHLIKSDCNNIYVKWDVVSNILLINEYF